MGSCLARADQCELENPPDGVGAQRESHHSFFRSERKFLLSGERDIDAFCTNKRNRRRRDQIELYPKGFTPLASLRNPKDDKKDSKNPS